CEKAAVPVPLGLTTPIPVITQRLFIGSPCKGVPPARPSGRKTAPSNAQHEADRAFKRSAPRHSNPMRTAPAPRDGGPGLHNLIAAHYQLSATRGSRMSQNFVKTLRGPDFVQAVDFMPD